MSDDLFHLLICCILALLPISLIIIFAIYRRELVTRHDHTPMAPNLAELYTKDLLETKK